MPADAMPLDALPVDVMRSALLSRAPGLLHGFSTRVGGVSRVYGGGSFPGQGDLNLGFTPDDDRDSVRENRRRFLHALHPAGFQHYALLRQEHTAIVHAVGKSQPLATDFAAPGALVGDGLMTDEPGILLAVGTADCIPVLVHDPVRRAVAAFHAGWRGTVARIVEHGVAAMVEAYSCDPGDMVAAVGPGIGPASYAVSTDVQRSFVASFGYATDLFTEREAPDADGAPGGRQPFLNLWEANRLQLLDAGLQADRIEVLAMDTATHTGRFFSHRAEHSRTGRMLSAIGLAS